MKKKDITALQAMKQPELVKMIRETKEKLAGFRITRYSKQSKNVREGREMRKKIAVASTIARLEEISHE